MTTSRVTELNADHDYVLALCAADPHLAKLIGLIGDLPFKISDDPFSSLVLSIVGQQLSAKAAATIRSRVKTLCGDRVSPDAIRALSEEELRAAGVSRPKIAYIRDLAERIHSGRLDIAALREMDDEAAVQALTEIKGIGTWTAEMFLIFALGRLDVMSYADVGLQRAAKWAYDLPETPKLRYLQQVEGPWSPYRSVASLYLWAAIDHGYVDSGRRLDALASAD
ncbi:DNA-3-methyladenine glycosylase family protein [Cohnella nanjingensis]|uniref:DNA-3-methyladenine glycosylase II n=1 Tax=Cohnella nanjingensis TaxID=1387779 RepID=A0A7X0VH99_9BACL|nr:DNA-3-methyladenine glycosylase [Cohnella nanjingensis]MBB6673253.1 DNA-3-methyladenine glycosylase 2 family protein [Cohnella nanjingensis]